VIFRLHYAVKHQYIAKIAENLSSIVSCTLHRIKVPEPVTVKSVIEELNKLIKRINNIFASVSFNFSLVSEIISIIKIT